QGLAYLGAPSKEDRDAMTLLPLLATVHRLVRCHGTPGLVDGGPGREVSDHDRPLQKVRLLRRVVVQFDDVVDFHSLGNEVSIPRAGKDVAELYGVWGAVLVNHDLQLRSLRDASSRQH